MADAHALPAHPDLAEQFDDLAQQREADTLGIWIFLATELMLFGGMFAAYTVYRWVYRAGFVAGSQHMELIVGAINTAVLITSSFTMAQAVQAAQLGRTRSLVRRLAATAALGAVFLALKGYEYWSHYREGLVPGRLWRYEGAHGNVVEVFFFLYYAMTGLHAVHLTVGVGLVSVLIVLTRRGAFTPSYHTPVEVIALYWHLIDVIWIFLFPIFYLVM